MKAILVLDEMPETCVECPCFERHEKDEWWCDAYGNYIGDEKPEWCPLKPMPNKQEHKKGWIYGEDEYGQDGYYCPHCYKHIPLFYDKQDADFIKAYKYCPFCGMRVEMEETE